LLRLKKVPKAASAQAPLPQVGRMGSYRWTAALLVFCTLVMARAGRTLPIVSSQINSAGPPTSSLTQVAPGVYLYKDTCNVYAIVKGDQAVLIDFGSGGILDQLPAIGVRKVGWILHTHFHRDQAQGDPIAKARGIKIAVPAGERKYFENVEEMWNQKKVLDLYDMRNEFQALRENIHVDAALEGQFSSGSRFPSGSIFKWNGIELHVIKTPGHTEGSVSYLYETEGKRLLFCGDLVASEGMIPTMHDLEWVYVGTQGIAEELGSLNNMRDLAPDMMLPSHGSPSENMLRWTPQLLADLARIYHEYDWINDTQFRPSPGPVHLTKHIWQMRRAFDYGVGYVIVCDTGHAFLWDVNAKEVSFLKDMEKIAGFKTIDFIIPSHYHDDHVGGINAVKKAYGAQLWAMKHLVDVLQRPSAYNLPCLWPEPMKVDRVLHDGEKIMWQGIPLQFFYLPGQTEYTEGMLIEDEGKKFLFDGDNVGHPLPGMPMYGHFVCRNYQRIGGGHVYAAKKLLELKPDYVCPNHFEWSPATLETLNSYLKSSEEIQQIWSRIIDQPDPEMGVDNNCVSFYPYQSEAGPGDTLQYDLRVRNWIERPSQVRARIKLPAGWIATPGAVEIDAPARSEASARFEVRIPSSETRKNCRFVLTADVWQDGKHLGELTEGLVNMLPMKAH
jgi:glyoxylase-like metal-dependent hydrolase (beta-lactamase superfamily II)